MERTNTIWHPTVKADDFDHGYYLSIKDTVQRLFKTLDLQEGYKQDQKLIDLDILIANLLVAAEERRPLRISLNNNDWSKSRYRRASYFTIDLVEQLHKLGYIEMKKVFHKEEGTSRMTRIWATDKLLKYFNR